ncbi:hypothetical protein EB796_016332 [Bugula neritina]|uniref:Uncharacterized protein n=1 Tax=Bugula neritina TaxID=10212 RepID=A0A7J7JH43_BUGNE|nr:hypothetical protein EB796_016332 [Bugula neritina]
MEMLIEKADSHTVTVAKHQLDDQDNDPRHIFKTNSLCYKEWKKEKKKLRRKLRRQQLAKQEAKVESSSPSEETVDSEDERQKSLKQHELWLLKEKEAQAAWRAKQSYYRHLKEQKQLQENKIREEWEAKQAAEREEEEKKRIEEAEAKRQQVKFYTDLRFVELETTLVIQYPCSAK